MNLFHAPFDSHINVFCLFQLNQIRLAIFSFELELTKSTLPTTLYLSEMKHQKIIQLFRKRQKNEKGKDLEGG